MPETFAIGLGAGLLLAASALRALQPQASDKLMEAQVYSGFARDAYDCKGAPNPGGPLAGARKWTLQAILTAGLAAHDAETQVFLDRQRRALAALDKWEQVLSDGPKAVKALLVKGELRRAEALVDAEGAPSCDARLVALREPVRTRRVLFDSTVAAGALYETAEPARALREYKAAERIDREDPELKQKIRRLSRHSNP